MKKTQLQQLRKENKLRAQFLGVESRETLRNLLQYADASRMSAFDQEVLYKDIVGMALAAEQQGRTLSETLGGDLKAACQGMVEGIGPAEPRERLLYNGWYAAMLATLAVLVHFQTPGMTFQPVTLHSLLFIVGYPLVCLTLSRFVARRYLFATGWRQVMPGVYLIGLLAAYVVLIRNLPLSNIPLFYAPPLPILLFFAALAVGLRLAYDRYMESIAGRYNWRD